MVGTPPPTAMPIAKSPTVSMNDAIGPPWNCFGTAAAFELRAQRHPDLDFGSVVVDRYDLQSEKPDEG
jgi:hypothetical protein